MSAQRVEHLADGVTLYCADCRDVLASFSECFRVDAVVSDPPYGVGYEGSTTKHGKNGFGYESFNDTPEEIKAVCVPAIRQAVSIARSAVITPGSANAFKYDEPRAIGVIFYPSGANSGPWGFICSQPLFYYGKDPYLAKALGSRPNGFATTESTDRSIDHPCPKPIGQTKWMVSRVSFEGETVLDPFMGSGTTGVACISLGRKFIGIEREPKYFEIAVRRISDALARPDLFIPSPKPAEKKETFL
jgi:DNA modification methylase